MRKNKNDSLGRSLIKNRFGNKGRKNHSDSFLHTSELKEENDSSKLNLHSVTEEDSLREFLSTAELAGTEFAAEKLNVTFVNPRSGVGLLTQQETKEILTSQEKYKELLKIPRRPKWNLSTTAKELQAREREEFLFWRRNLAQFQEETNLIVTPYEKNLDFWRQLWRVVERSDVVVQIVDARNPLLFRCEDLEQYVKEVDRHKLNVVLCNKADFLTRNQRRKWAQYFSSMSVTVVFFSALKSDDENKVLEIDGNGCDESEEEDGEEKNINYEDNDFETDEEEEVIGGEDVNETVYCQYKNSSKLLTREELINFFRTYPHRRLSHATKDVITIGLVGYPNVGKSSTINTLLAHKKVPVSATPGKTKHFQTLYLDKDILLCDCPGLVMPSFALTKADMIINGILPIDQMRDHVPPINLICTLIPRCILEQKYGIMIPKPEEGEDPNRTPFSEELLNAYAYNRGFMTANGQPDNSRASRYVLKDFVNGKLLYCYAPPNVNQEEFHHFNILPEKSELNVPNRTLRSIKPFSVAARDLEYALFKEQSTPDAHIKGFPKFDSNTILKLQIEKEENQKSNSKPWKNHKEKRNKHVKLRKKYSCLDH